MNEDDATEWIRNLAHITIGARYSKEALAARLAALAFLMRKEEIRGLSVCQLARKVGIGHSTLYDAIRDMRGRMASNNRITEENW